MGRFSGATSMPVALAVQSQVAQVPGGVRMERFLAKIKKEMARECVAV